VKRWLAVLAVAAASPAHAADTWARIGEGAPVYATFKPGAVLGVLKRIGVGDIPEVQSLTRVLGGADVFDPRILAPTGVDPDQPVVASFLEAAGPKAYRYRIVVGLKDAGVFKTVLASVASGQTPLKMTEANTPKDPVAAASDKHGALIVRIDGDVVIVDAVTVTGGKAPTSAELAKRWPLTPAKPVLLSRGARRALVDSTIGVTVDGRKIPAMIDAAAALGTAYDGDPLVKPATAACKATWSKAPTVFDDIAFTVTGTDVLQLALVWGSTSGQLPLKFKPVDDGGLDVSQLALMSTVTLVDYDASLSPLSGLPRSGPYASEKALESATDKCGALGWANVLVRGWPTALATLIGLAKESKDPIQMAALNMVGKIRNVALSLRDFQGDEPRWVAAATLDPQAQPTLTQLVALLGGGNGTPTPYGKRTPTVYEIGQEGDKVAIAIDTLPSGPLAVALADSADTLGWAYRPVTRMPGAPPPPSLVPGLNPPIIAAGAEGTKLLQLLPALKLSKADEKSTRAVLSHLKRVDSDVRIDGDTFRWTARATLR
jgi:hypothetical protein